MIRRILLSFLICGASTAYGAVGVQNTPASKHGYNLSITGSLRADFYTGSNQVKDSVLFDKRDILDIITNEPWVNVKQGASINVKGRSIPIKDQQTLLCINGSRLWFVGEYDSGPWVYRFNLIFTGDGSSASAIREIYAQIENDTYGSFLAGDTKGIEQRGFGPADIIPGTGGFNGNLGKFLNTTTGVYIGLSVIGDTGNSTKVCYFTPRVGGLQLCASYTPNTQHMGEANMNAAQSPRTTFLQVFDLNSLALGVNYVYEAPQFTAKLSAVRLTGTSKPIIPNQPLLERHNTRSYDFGIMLGAGSWSVAAEYLRNGNSGTLTNNLSKITPTIDGVVLPSKAYYADTAGKNWGLGLGMTYKEGDTSLGVSYYYTKSNTGIVSLGSQVSSIAVGKALVFSAEYRLAAGLASYIEAGFYRMHNPDWAYMGGAFAALTGTPSTFSTVPSNRAKIFLSGLKIQF